MPSLIEKRDALFSEVETVLNAHRSDVQGQKYFRRLDRLQQSRKARLQVMGDPTDTIWYFRVFSLDAQVTSEQPDGTADKLRHDFAVTVFYEWADSDSYSGSTQETWEEMMHATGSPIGLFEHLAGMSQLQSGGSRSKVRPPEPIGQGDIFGIRQLDSQGNEWAHVAEWRQALIDYEPRN